MNVTSLIVAVVALVIPPIPPAPVIPPPPILPIPPIPIPCVPVPLPGCGGPVVPPPPPPATDDPPRFTGNLAITKRTPTSLTVAWKAATDDHGVKLYLLQRDGRVLGARGPQGRSHRFVIACGEHKYRVVAVDVYAQRAAIEVTVKRKC